MSRRSGERSGWIGGWLGGFIWVVILAAILLFRGEHLAGALGLAIAAAAVTCVFAGAPWKHPATPYWKLMLPIYALFFAAIAWAVRAGDGAYSFGLNPWHTLLLLPILAPFWTVGHRRWSESDDRGGSQPGE